MKIQLIVLSQPSCVQCESTYRKLNKLDIPHTSFNLGDPAQALAGQAFHEEAKELSYMQAPVVLVKDGETTIDHWSGFQPDKLNDYKYLAPQTVMQAAA